MRKINQKLKNLYEEEAKLLLQEDLPSDIDGTNLMYCWEDEYLDSRIKMLFLGRESNGWMGDLNLNVHDCVKRYKDFELCEKGRYTTFWQYIYETKNILMPETIGQKNFLWSNVSKFSKLNGKAISEENFRFLTKKFNVLEKEITITKPDVIIFLTGYKWDFKIEYQIENNIRYHQLEDTINTSQLARLSSVSLPYHTYRVPHPITMQLNKKWIYMEKIIDRIKSDFIEK